MNRTTSNIQRRFHAFWFLCIALFYLGDLTDFKYTAADGEQEEQGDNMEHGDSNGPSILEQAASIFNTISRTRWWMSPEAAGNFARNMFGYDIFLLFFILKLTWIK